MIARAKWVWIVTAANAAVLVLLILDICGTMLALARGTAAVGMTSVGEWDGIGANQRATAEVKHWSCVSAFAVGPDGRIYVLGSVGEVLPRTEQSFAWGTQGPGHDYLYALDSNGTPKWRLSLGGDALKVGPSGAVYLASDQNLYAISPQGAREWRFPFTGRFAWIDFGRDGSVYLAADGALYALKSDGTLKWKVNVQCPPMLGPDGTLYLAAGNVLSAVSPGGKRKWSLSLGKGPIRAIRSPQPKSANAWTIYAVGNDALHAVAPDGTEKWSFPFTGSPDSVAFGPDGMVYLVANTAKADGLVYALNSDGSLKWKFAAPKSACGEEAEFNQMNEPRVAPDGTLLILACPGVVNENHPGGIDMRMLYALKPDGSLKWQFSEIALMGLEVKGPGANGDVYIEEDWGFYGGELAAIGPDGKKKWHIGSGHFDLAFGADGTIYAADNVSGEMGVCPSGTLYAYTPSGHRKWCLDELCVSNLDGCPGRPVR